MKAQVAGLMPETLLKKETQAQLFSYEFCEFFKKTFPTEHLPTTASGGNVLAKVLNQNFLRLLASVCNLNYLQISVNCDRSIVKFVLLCGLILQ